MCKDKLIEKKILYDTYAKQILAEKSILANIMKYVVEECKDFSVDFIAKECIEGAPEIGSLEVMPQIYGDNTENIDGDNKVFFDIRFNAKIPGNDKPIYIIINVEAQNEFYPGYPIVKRGIFYTSRMISGQYGKIFVKSEYDKIRKVYSIWICTHPSKASSFTINRYRVTEDSLVGNRREKPSDYDLLQVVIICLGKQENQKLTGILKLLNLLFGAPKLTDKARKNLKDEFDINLTPALEKGVAKMCNWSDGIYNDGYEAGIKLNQLNNASVMLADNLPLAKIIQYTGLTEQEILDIRDKSNTPKD